MSDRLRWTLLAAVLSACLSAPGWASVENLGFAELYEVDTVTVVYPAGPTGEAERNRRSAETRARFLHLVHGVDARVVSDADFGEAEQDATLLVLGWNNRVLGSVSAVRPFVRDGDRVTFLGVQMEGPDIDLAIRHRSPFAPARDLYFWSRIDPETDRFMTLPAFGSDWALFDTFLPVAQGMFVEDPAWPPRRNPDAERDHREDIVARDAKLAKRNTPHYSIRFDPEAFRASDIEAVSAAREAAFAEAEAALGAAPEGFRIDLYLYPDRDDKDRFTGVGGEVHSVVRDRALHMTARYARSAAPHEEIHHLARQRFGPTYGTAIYEGLSFSFRPTFRGKDLGFHAAMLLDQDALPGLAVLFDEAALKALPEHTAFPASGLLATWIREDGRPELLEAAWSLEWPSAERYATVAGRSTVDLDRAFRTWVGKRARRYDKDVEFVHLQERARERHLEGDYAGVAAALAEALVLRPDDHQTAFNLASARMRTAEYDAAERGLRAILDAGLAGDHELVVYGHFQLGRLYDLMGRREAALVEYRAVLALPDLRDSHRSAQEGIEVPFTADRLQ